MTRDQATRLASESLKKVKWSRWYATDPVIMLGLGALIAEAAEAAADWFETDEGFRIACYASKAASHK